MKKNKKYYLYEMNTTFLNVVSIIIMVFMILLTYFVIKVKNPSFECIGSSFIWTYCLMIPYFILHEIFHSIAYVLHGAKFNNITYGMHLEKGVLCCLCKQNISRKNILISLVYPFIFLGVITYILGVIFNNYILIFLSLMNISGCSGDLMMFYSLIRLKNYEYSEFDDPTSFGLYTSEDLSKRKLPCMKNKGETDKLEINDYKKINISKESIIIIIAFLLIGIIGYFL